MPQGRAASPRVALVARLLLIATVVTVAVIVFTPGPPDAEGQQRLARWLDAVHQTWMPGWVTFGLIEFASNVLMFLPLGLFGALALRSRRYLVVPACLALSCLVELVQWLGLPDRDGSWRDILANTVGALIGYLVACLVLRRSTRRAESAGLASGSGPASGSGAGSGPASGSGSGGL